MIPPFVFDCECCGRPFLADIMTIDDDDVICDAHLLNNADCFKACRLRLDGLAAAMFNLGNALEGISQNLRQSIDMSISAMTPTLSPEARARRSPLAVRR